MKIFTKAIPAFLLFLAAFCAQNATGQSVLNPADTVYTYNSTAAAGSRTNPNQPAAGVIGKWVRTVRLGWNSSEWKCYIYNGVPFRLHFPKSYNPTANDGKKYPMMIFYHGAGEAGVITDNELSMAHGGQNVFQANINNGVFDGYVIIPQNTNGAWDPTAITRMKLVMDYMITNNKLDPFHIIANGLSAGGGATWGNMFQYPQVICADMPMSANNQSNSSASNLALSKYTPVWTWQGGLDTWPNPNDAGIVNTQELAAGAQYKYQIYPTLGHDTWDNAWAEPDFWPFANRAYSSNPWPLFGQTAFCPGAPINVTMGVAPGFDAYQWRKNDTLISGSTSNSIVVTKLGKYDCRVQRNGIWSDWSHTPVNITIRLATVTPPITVQGLASNVIPALDNPGVTLQMPAGYASYVWQKVGNSTTISSTRTLNVTTPGQYIAEVTETGGCSSSFGSPFTVVDAHGPNAPDAPSSLSASPLSQTSLLLNWSQNPAPSHNETAFEIYQGSKAGGPYKLVAILPADASKDTITGLNAGIKYYYIMRAVDATAASASSNEANATTSADVQAPTAPGALTVTGNSVNSVSLGWTASTDNVAVTSYDIYVNGVMSYTVPATQTSFTIFGLINGQSNVFVVKARDFAGNVSVPSNQVSGEALINGIRYKYYNNLSTSLSKVPDYNSLATAFTGALPNFSLSPQQDGINFGFLFDGFIIIPTTGTYTFETNSDDGSNLYLGALGQTTSPYSFTATPLVNNDGLHGGQNRTSAPITLTAGIYPIAVSFFQIGGGFGLNVLWKTPGSNNFVTIPNSAFMQNPVVTGQAPAFPTNLSATALSYKSIGLTWTDNSNNETGFEVSRSMSPVGPFNIVGTTGANVTAFTDSALQASTSYYYRIQAINQYGSSGYDPSTISGVNYSYYSSFSGNNLSSLNSLTPVSTGILNNVSLSPATATTNFAFKFLGYITIPTSGNYTFYTSSDDGSDLYVGGYDTAHLVVKNDFLQGQTERSGTVNLNTGRYPIYVTYFQQGGGFVLTTSYQGPGIAKQLIPDSAWFAGKNTSATTLALPALPTAPTNLTAMPTSAARITINWLDNANNESNYQVFRSNNNNQSYVLLAVLPANTVSFKDSGLFANATYFYKVNAMNAGGASAFTNERSATTLDIPPVMTKLTDQQARYGTTTIIPVSATIASGAIVLTPSNLPAFAQFTDNGNGTGKITLNPASSDAGTYSNLTVTASDAFGGSDHTSFNLAINNNFAPTLDSIGNYSMSEGDTVTIPLNGHNVNPADTLTISLSNLPANSYTLTQGINGVGTLVLQPGYAAAGNYTVTAVVNDKNGLSVSRSFVVAIANKDPYVKIYTRVKYQVDAPAPWNNLTGTTTANLKDQNGNTTSVGITFNPTSWWSPYNGGPVTGNNSGVYPDAVLQEYYYFGFFSGPANPTIVLSGLSTNKKYDLTFFASSVLAGIGDNGITSYTVGSRTVTLAVQNNLQNTALLDTITPAPDGTITVTLGKVTSYPPGYLNALVIANHFDDGTAPAAPSNLQAQIVSKGIGLTWNDVAYNETGYKLYRSKGDSLSYALVSSLPAGATSFTDSTTNGNNLYYYKVNANNTVGVSGYSNQASITSPDRIPQVTPIPDVTVNNNQTLQVNITATDDATDQLTLTASGLPSFATFVDNGNGTGVITLAPTVGLQGTFPNVTITATDLADSSRSASFSINVVDPDLSYAYLNVTTPGHAAPAPWNNMVLGFPYAGSNFTNLLSQTGAATGITVTFNEQWTNVAETGMKRRNGSDVYPESVLNSSFFANDNNVRHITITGLNPAKGYNFLFFASHFISESTLTNFTANGQTISLNGSQNSNKTAQLNGIIPDASGTVVISCQKDAAAKYALLSALVIESYTPGGTTPFSPADLRVLDFNKTNTINLQWQDRANNETGYEVWRAPHGGSYAKLATLPANTTAYLDASLPANTSFDYTVRAINGTTASAYSNPAQGRTYAGAVFIFLNRIWAAPYNFPSAPPPFNNLNWIYQALGTTWSNFSDENGLPTNVGMVQPTEWDEVDPFGASTGNNSGVYPDAAMGQGWLNFVGDSSYLTITGLDASKKYDFTLFGSCTDDPTANSSTVYHINGQAGILNAHMNTSGTITFFGITPDQSGNVSIGVKAYDSSNSSFAVLGNIAVKGYTPTSGSVSPAPSEEKTKAVTATAATFAQSAQNNLASARPLAAYPNPFDGYFNLSVPAQDHDNIMVTVVDGIGRIVYAQRFENLTQGNNLLRVQTGSSTPTGIYFVKVLYLGRNEQKLIKMIRK